MSFYYTWARVTKLCGSDFLLGGEVTGISAPIKDILIKLFVKEVSVECGVSLYGLSSADCNRK